jgi:mono/diheme cytochrome c family protein
MKKTFACLVFLSVFLFFACGKDEASKASYQNDVKPILSASCQSCHSASGSASSTGLFYDSYESTAASAAEQKNGENRLLGAIKHKAGFTAMPDGSPKLSDEKIALIEEWILDGRQNN